jgi:tetratricopeptide (TPR) repeat protein
MACLQTTRERFPSHALARALVATLVLACLPKSAHAADESPPRLTVDATTDDALPADAQAYLLEGAQAFRFGHYRGAERNFAQVARLAPRWYAIYFNQAVVAEAQGKVGAAIRSYETFLPHADPAERDALQARMAELERRRDQGVRLHRRQAALGGTVLAVGMGLFAAGLTMTIIGMQRESAQGFDVTSKTRALIGGGIASLIAGAGLTFGLGTTLLLRARRTKRNIAFLPAPASFRPILAAHPNGRS